MNPEILQCVPSGGGTVYQKEAGFDDSVQAMLDYLRLEAGDAVTESTLARFCAESVRNLEWLAEQGVPFEGSMAPGKTSHPTNDYYLYYSGSESVPRFRDAAPPAPRGSPRERAWHVGKSPVRGPAAGGTAP